MLGMAVPAWFEMISLKLGTQIKNRHSGISYLIALVYRFVMATGKPPVFQVVNLCIKSDSASYFFRNMIDAL